MSTRVAGTTICRPMSSARVGSTISPPTGWKSQNRPPEAARARQRGEVLSCEGKERVALDDRVQAVVGKRHVAEGLTLGELQAPRVVADGLAERVPGADEDGHQAPLLRISLVTRTSKISSNVTVAV